MMFQAGWKIEETEVRQLIVDSQTLIDVFDCESADVIVTNVSGRLSSLRPRLRSFLRDMYPYVTCIDMYRQKRTPASHVFVLMISSEQRRVKPYAIPIQCLPYTSMDHTTMR